MNPPMLCFAVVVSYKSVNGHRLCVSFWLLNMGSKMEWKSEVVVVMAAAHDSQSVLT